MKTKIFLLAILANLILISGCSKKEEVTNDQPVNNEIMNLYKQLESYIGVDVQTVKADLISQGFQVDTTERGKDFYVLKKSENNINYYFLQHYNLELENKVYSIFLSLESLDSKATLVQPQTYREFIGVFGDSHTLPSGAKVVFYGFNTDDYSGKTWSEMQTCLDKKFSNFHVEWFSEGVVGREKVDATCVKATLIGDSLELRIQDKTYEPIY